jgi:hypothetical protein
MCDLTFLFLRTVKSIISLKIHGQPAHLNNYYIFSKWYGNLYLHHCRPATNKNRGKIVVGCWCAVHSPIRCHTTLLLVNACSNINEWKENYEEYSTSVVNAELGVKVTKLKYSVIVNKSLRNRVRSEVIMTDVQKT